MERNYLQPNNPHNASFAPNPAAANQQQGANPQARPVPPLANAADLANQPAARNLQTYNASSTPQGWIDAWNWQEYQPIQPGLPYMEKLADEAMNTKKVELLLKHAQEYKELGELQDAEGEYAKALKYTENTEHYQLYAGCLKAISTTLKDETKANIYREKAARAFYYLGDLYQKQGALQEAQAAYKDSCDLVLYEAPLQALVDLARQVGEKGGIATALEKLADFYAQKGAIALAIDKLNEAFEVGKIARVLEKLEALYSQNKEEDSQSNMHAVAIQRFELQISQDPKNIGLYRKYAWFLKDIGRKSEARAVKERMDELLQTMQQKIVKQKTRIQSLEHRLECSAEQLQENNSRGNNTAIDGLPKGVTSFENMKDADIIPLLKKNPSLESLDLGGCKHLTNAVLHILPERFENLKELNLRGCKRITEAGLEAIVENASNLKHLTLDNCPGTTIKVLHKLNAKGITFTIEGVTFKKNVLDLSPRYNLTDEELAKALEANPETTELNLTRCTNITDAGLAPLKNFQWLTSLNLHGCDQITDAGLEHIANLTQLTELKLGHCKLTDAGFQHLAGFSQLTSLKWYDCSQLTDAGFQHIASFSRLSALDLQYCHQVTDAGLQNLAGLTQLTELKLSSCRQFTDAGLQHLAGLTQLKELHLHWCEQLTGAGFQHLAGLTQLKILNLSRCWKLTDAGLQHLAGLTQLSSLNLGSCQQLTDAGLQHLAGLSQLTHLNLREGFQLTDAGLQHLAGLTQLSSLDLSYCNKLTDAGLQHLRGLHQLTWLSLNSCKQLTDGSFQHFDRLFRLTSLDLYGCDKFTSNAKEQFKKRRPKLGMS